MSTNSILTGFVIGSALARSAGATKSDSSRAGMIAAMFPNPLAGVLVARAVARPTKPTPAPAPASGQGKNPTP